MQELVLGRLVFSLRPRPENVEGGTGFDSRLTHGELTEIAEPIIC
jgi:hypothetical protein